MGDNNNSNNSGDMFKRTLTYYGTTTPLSVARRRLAATTVGDYALFGGGGGYDSSRENTVDVYNKNLIRTVATPLSAARDYLAATTVGNYALFGGGAYDNPTVDAYNKNLVRTDITNLSIGRHQLAATTVGDYALFGGGYGSGYSRRDTVDVYNKNLIRTVATPLSVAKDSLAATTVGNYALFGGGRNTPDVVDAYNENLVRSIATPLSVGRYFLAATTVGDYALFGGGLGDSSSGYSRLDTVDVYNNNLVRSIATPLSENRQDPTATSVGNYALFGGGSRGKNTVDVYDNNLVRTNATPLSVGRYELAATTVGDYALFGGGYHDSSRSYLAVVDVYKLNLTTIPTIIDKLLFSIATIKYNIKNMIEYGGIHVSDDIPFANYVDYIDRLIDNDIDTSTNEGIYRYNTTNKSLTKITDMGVDYLRFDDSNTITINREGLQYTMSLDKSPLNPNGDPIVLLSSYEELKPDITIDNRTEWSGINFDLKLVNNKLHIKYNNESEWIELDGNWDKGKIWVNGYDILMSKKTDNKPYRRDWVYNDIDISKLPDGNNPIHGLNIPNARLKTHLEYLYDTKETLRQKLNIGVEVIFREYANAILDIVKSR